MNDLADNLTMAETASLVGNPQISWIDKPNEVN
jgi:hypothetical protein